MEMSQGDLPDPRVDLGSRSPIPVRYELRHTMLRKLRAGEDPLPDITGGRG